MKVKEFHKFAMAKKYTTCITCENYLIQLGCIWLHDVVLTIKDHEEGRILAEGSYLLRMTEKKDGRGLDPML